MTYGLGSNEASGVRATTRTRRDSYAPEPSQGETRDGSVSLWRAVQLRGRSQVNPVHWSPWSEPAPVRRPHRRPRATWATASPDRCRSHGAERSTGSITSVGGSSVVRTVVALADGDHESSNQWASPPAVCACHERIRRARHRAPAPRPRQDSSLRLPQRRLDRPVQRVVASPVTSFAGIVQPVPSGSSCTTESGSCVST